MIKRRRNPAVSPAVSPDLPVGVFGPRLSGLSRLLIDGRSHGCLSKLSRLPRLVPQRWVSYSARVPSRWSALLHWELDCRRFAADEGRHTAPLVVVERSSLSRGKGHLETACS